MCPTLRKRVGEVALNNGQCYASVKKEPKDPEVASGTHKHVRLEPYSTPRLTTCQAVH